MGAGRMEKVQVGMCVATWRVSTKVRALVRAVPSPGGVENHFNELSKCKAHRGHAGTPRKIPGAYVGNNTRQYGTSGLT